MIIPSGAHLDDGYRKCLGYLRNRRHDEYPTAIVCYNDLVALGVMSALREMQIKEPDEISVIGNDDISSIVRAGKKGCRNPDRKYRIPRTLAESKRRLACGVGRLIHPSVQEIPQ